jgi:hypothetical protein
MTRQRHDFICRRHGFGDRTISAQSHGRRRQRHFHRRAVDGLADDHHAIVSDSQSASLGDNGLVLSGPGNFNISANTIDLGISGGISVTAPDSALAAISPYGANINVTTAGDLEMTSTKIANESYLGGINLNVGGTLDVGGQLPRLATRTRPKEFSPPAAEIFLSLRTAT